MKRIFLLLVVMGTMLIMSLSLLSGPTSASPDFQVTITPTLSIYLPLVCGGESCKMFGINFSPYIDDDEDPDKGGEQISDKELRERLARIAPYAEWIRTFGCNEDL